MTRCPTCGREVDEKTAKGTSQDGGQTYYFCCTGCKADFDRDPEHYLRGGASEGHGGHHHHGEHSHHGR